MDTLDRLLLAAPYVPILVFSGAEDEDIASQTVRHGAQDYFPKSHLDGQRHRLKIVMNVIRSCAVKHSGTCRGKA